MVAFRPFIGFSLAEMKTGLIVDSIFVGGPAHQVGLRPKDKIKWFGSEATVPTTLVTMREAIAKNCVTGRLTKVAFEKNGGSDIIVANVWVMTSEAKAAGKPYYFDSAKGTRETVDNVGSPVKAAPGGKKNKK
eukprot:GFYU01019261.1.p1 GENE.GFYU01019261.1~~GFYU01019261.1.p1  ORF type:complete len:150 (-),score=21.09 GFYU01019261.1:21-419(-)